MANSGKAMPATVSVLMVAQAMAMSTAPLFVLSGGIVGYDLAPRPGLATLPVAMVIVGTALSVVPVTRLMRTRGRKPVFIAGTLLAAAAAVIAALAISAGHFVAFSSAALLSGVSLAVAQQYRFAASEAVAPSLAGTAVSRLLLGGLVAAYIGPELVVWGAEYGADLGMVSPHPGHQSFIGAFLLLSVVCCIGLLVLLLGFRDQLPPVESAAEDGRPLAAILTNPLIWLAIVASAMGYAMMSLLMTATPLHMHSIDGHSLLAAKWVIQSHIVAMFAPAFFSGWLISKYGHRRVITLGVLAYICCLLVAQAGPELMHYWAAMVLLGIGWNFMFVAGTALLPLCHTPAERFKVQTANEFSVFGLQAIAALSSGWVVQTFGWDTLLGLGAVAVAVVLVALWFNRVGPMVVGPAREKS